MCVGVLSVGLGPGLDSMSPARSRRSASHAAGTHGRLPQKTGRPGLQRGGVGGYNLHSVPPNSPPDCGTVAHQPRAGCIRLVLLILVITFIGILKDSFIIETSIFRMVFPKIDATQLKHSNHPADVLYKGIKVKQQILQKTDKGNRQTVQKCYYVT